MNLEIKKLNETNEKLTLEVTGINEVQANTLRRIMISEIPIMAVDEIEFKSNDSALFDEIVAHRLGLVPLKTDLKSYKLKEKESDKGPIYETTLTLNEVGPKTVKASDLKPTDPSIVPVYPETPIVILLENQKIEAIATVSLGLAKDHAKYQSAFVYYTYKPKLTINNDSKKIQQFTDKYPNGAIKDNKFDEEAIINNNLYDACIDVNNELLKVEYEKDKFIFHIESYGQLTPKEILTTSIEVTNKKLDELLKKIKDSKGSKLKIPKLKKK